MLAVTRLAVAVAGAGIAINAAWHGAAAQNPIAHARDVRAALRVCWIAPADEAPRQISVRLSFNRDGQVVGQPLITYENPQPSEEGRAAVRDALAQALARCVPLPLTMSFAMSSPCIRSRCDWAKGGRAVVNQRPEANHKLPRSNRARPVRL
jgi:hypothetical protein